MGSEPLAPSQGAAGPADDPCKRIIFLHSRRGDETQCPHACLQTGPVAVQGPEKGEGGLRGTGHSPRSRAQPHGAIQALLSGAAEGTDAMGCCSPPASLARLWLCWPSPCYPSPRRRVSSSSRVTYRQGERAGEEGTGKGACHAACMAAGHSSQPGRAGSAFLPLLMSSSKGMAHERRQKGSEKRAVPTESQEQGKEQQGPSRAPGRPTCKEDKAPAPLVSDGRGCRRGSQEGAWLLPSCCRPHHLLLLSPTPSHRHRKRWGNSVLSLGSGGMGKTKPTATGRVGHRRFGKCPG